MRIQTAISALLLAVSLGIILRFWKDCRRLLAAFFGVWYGFGWIEDIIDQAVLETLFVWKYCLLCYIVYLPNFMVSVYWWKCG